MNDAPFLQTDRFDLWRPAATDLDGMCRLLSDMETRRYLGSFRAGPQRQFERLMRNAGSWMLHGYGNFAVRERGASALIASCGVFHSWRGFGAELGMDDVPEAGWIVRRDWVGKGVAKEVMDAVFSWFDCTHGPCRIACMIEEGNTASQRVAAIFGFKQYAHHCDDDGIKLNLLERVPALG